MCVIDGTIQGQYVCHRRDNTGTRPAAKRGFLAGLPTVAESGPRVRAGDWGDWGWGD